MYDGKIMEDIYAQEFFSFPKHPYSKVLLDSTEYLPIQLPGNQRHDPSESCCSYYSRCYYALENCKVGVLKISTETSSVYCNNPLRYSN
jgi:ABC-type dipeptide/oligopeptide/nickel transport system ATPase component